MSTKSRPEARAPSMTSACSGCKAIDHGRVGRAGFGQFLQDPPSPCIHELQLCPWTPRPATAPPQEHKPARESTSRSRAARMRRLAWKTSALSTGSKEDQSSMTSQTIVKQQKYQQQQVAAAVVAVAVVEQARVAVVVVVIVVVVFVVVVQVVVVRRTRSCCSSSSGRLCPPSDSLHAGNACRVFQYHATDPALLHYMKFM